MEAVSASLVTIHRFPVLKTPQTRTHFDPNYKPITRRKQRYTVIRCCKKRVWEGARKERDYYQLLGVSVNSSSQQIKQAYRKLQKKHHPDIAGHQGHEYTLLLNEAYQVLMKDNLRKEYDASIGKVRVGFGRNTSDLGYSTWKGPLRPEALFVDENACIGQDGIVEAGCRECVHHSSNTFIMDEITGCARVKVQYGDDEKKIEVSVDSCPVNCIHWVDAEDLPVLEFLIQPQPKEGHGLFGGGWDRPANVFMAAKTFTKQQKEKTEQHHRNAKATVQEEETPAQAAARANATRELEMERFSRIWNWFKKISGSDQME